MRRLATPVALLAVWAVVTVAQGPPQWPVPPDPVAGSVNWVIQHREGTCSRAAQLGDLVTMAILAWEISDPMPLVNDQYDSNDEDLPYFYNTFSGDGENVTIQDPTNLPLPGIESVLLGMCQFEQRKFVIPSSLMVGASSGNQTISNGSSVCGMVRLVSLSPKIPYTAPRNAYVANPRPGTHKSNPWSQTVEHTDQEVQAAKRRAGDEMAKETVHEWTMRRKRELQEEERRKRYAADGEDDDDDDDASVVMP